MKRWPHILLFFAAGCSGGPGTITGSATLPDCTDAPAVSLDGTWFDQGTVTITSDGCGDLGAENGSTWSSCALNWAVSQDGNDVELVVDEEYLVKGRICGETLHLAGGWWLPLQDENGQCNYDDDDGDEVGIESGGSSLTYSSDERGELFSGTLQIKGQCSATYEVELRRAG